MTNKSQSVENCLVLLSENSSRMDSRDKNLICSLANQVLKCIGLTDRQLGLARKKIDEYAALLEEIGINVEYARETVVLPIRSLDRSRWIRFDTSDDSVKITVRFLFAKKLISAIEQLRKHIPKDQKIYDAESKTWTFNYTESNLYNIVNIFKPYKFEIDKDLLNIYDQLCELDPEQIVPGVYNGKIKNLPNTAVEMLQNEIGTHNIDNLILYKDRSIRYGLHYFDQESLEKSTHKVSELAAKIANRSVPNIVIQYSNPSVERIVLAVEELERLPLLILVPNQTPEDIVGIHKNLRNIVPPEQTAVICRLNNTGAGATINAWIKENRLNNYLDSNIKIVYTIDDTTPQPIFRSGWKPRAVLSVIPVTQSSMIQSSMIGSMRAVLNYYADQDLIIHYNSNIITNYITNYFEVETI